MLDQLRRTLLTHGQNSRLGFEGRGQLPQLMRKTDDLCRANCLLLFQGIIIENPDQPVRRNRAVEQLTQGCATVSGSQDKNIRFFSRQMKDTRKKPAASW